MPRENAEAKARRYLGQGRLRIHTVSDRYVGAVCRGDGELYLLTGDEESWSCSCPAVSDRCAHLLALRLVTTRPLPQPPDAMGSAGSYRNRGGLGGAKVRAPTRRLSRRAAEKPGPPSP